MKKINKIYAVLFLAMGLVSCSDFLDENNQNGRYDDEIVWANPKLAEGVLLKAYNMLPNDYTEKYDYGTDDMATNLVTDNTVTMATGGWTSRNTPFGNEYKNAFQAILHVNDFLENMEKVDFAPLSDETVKQQYQDRLRGEAYALRAWWQAKLLTIYGGEDNEGNLWGFPIVTSTIQEVEAAKLPRDSYADCVKQILADCDEALKTLPLKWEGDDRVIGSTNINRMNGLSVMALKARVLLTAASKAFAKSGYTMEQAAEAAAAVMNANGKLDNLADTRGLTFYNLGTKDTDKEYLNTCKEVLWYSSIGNSSNRESRMFPPSLFGKGEINPSQNLVNSFPDKNGYPITDPSTVYNPADPYANRDPRLDLYIYHNGSKVAGANNVTLNMETGDDKIGAKTTSTRTGYYMKKLLDEAVSLKVGSVITTPHYHVRMRYTEVLLNFAEAANAAVGPTGEIGGFTARQVINALRKRAGITNEAYVNSLDQTGLSELIKNERRIELCFEGFRFWDLRRWMDLSRMNESVKGYDASTMREIPSVEVRKYEDYMIYAPIPYSETQKYDLIQNKGWE